MALAMPPWRDVPFFHELPAQQRQDFHLVHPTWWELGRGEELAALHTSHPELWEYFDRDAVMGTSPKTFPPKDAAFRAICHRCAQRQVWLLAFLQELRELNSVTAALQR